MYTNFDETCLQWYMTKSLTHSKVIQGHKGQKGHFHQKGICPLDYIKHSHMTHAYESAWPPPQKLWS